MVALKGTIVSPVKFNTFLYQLLNMRTFLISPVVSNHRLAAAGRSKKAFQGHICRRNQTERGNRENLRSVLNPRTKVELVEKKQLRARGTSQMALDLREKC